MNDEPPKFIIQERSRFRKKIILRTEKTVQRNVITSSFTSHRRIYKKIIGIVKKTKDIYNGLKHKYTEHWPLVYSISIILSIIFAIILFIFKKYFIASSESRVYFALVLPFIYLMFGYSIYLILMRNSKNSNFEPNIILLFFLTIYISILIIYMIFSVIVVNRLQYTNK